MLLLRPVMQLLDLPRIKNKEYKDCYLLIFR
jgi:hypothetical protein